LTGEKSAGSDEVEVYSFGVGDGLDVNFGAVVVWKVWLRSWGRRGIVGLVKAAIAVGESRMGISLGK
jgi:hypothetical protein